MARQAGVFRWVAFVAFLMASAPMAQANWLSGFHWRVTPARSFEQHFAPLENLESIDVALINEAGETIDLAAYVLTDIPVIEALADAARRGVRVRIFRQFDPSDPSPRIAAAMKALLAAGAEERFKEPGSPLMHLKAYCIDRAAFRFGAANFSPSGLKRQDNDLDIMRGAHACDAFEADFERLWL